MYDLKARNMGNYQNSLTKDARNQSSKLNASLNGKSQCQSSANLRGGEGNHRGKPAKANPIGKVPWSLLAQNGEIPKKMRSYKENADPHMEYLAERFAKTTMTFAALLNKSPTQSTDAYNVTQSDMFSPPSLQQSQQPQPQQMKTVEIDLSSFNGLPRNGRALSLKDLHSDLAREHLISPSVYVETTSPDKALPHHINSFEVPSSSITQPQRKERQRAKEQLKPKNSVSFTVDLSSIQGPASSLPPPKWQQVPAKPAKSPLDQVLKPTPSNLPKPSEKSRQSRTIQGDESSFTRYFPGRRGSPELTRPNSSVGLSTLVGARKLSRERSKKRLEESVQEAMPNLAEKSRSVPRTKTIDEILAYGKTKSRSPAARRDNGAMPKRKELSFFCGEPPKKSQGRTSPTGSIKREKTIASKRVFFDEIAFYADFQGCCPATLEFLSFSQVFDVLRGMCMITRSAESIADLTLRERVLTVAVFRALTSDSLSTIQRDRFYEFLLAIYGTSPSGITADLIGNPLICPERLTESISMTLIKEEEAEVERILSQLPKFHLNEGQMRLQESDVSLIHGVFDDLYRKRENLMTKIGGEQVEEPCRESGGNEKWRPIQKQHREYVIAWLREQGIDTELEKYRNADLQTLEQFMKDEITKRHFPAQEKTRTSATDRISFTDSASGARTSQKRPLGHSSSNSSLRPDSSNAGGVSTITRTAKPPGLPRKQRPPIGKLTQKDPKAAQNRKISFKSLGGAQQPAKPPTQASSGQFAPPPPAVPAETTTKSSIEERECRPQAPKAIEMPRLPSVSPPRVPAGKVPLLYIDVNLDNGKSERIVVYDNDNIGDVVRSFAMKFRLDSSTLKNLKELLESQVNQILTKIEEEEEILLSASSSQDDGERRSPIRSHGKLYPVPELQGGGSASRSEDSENNKIAEAELESEPISVRERSVDQDN